MSKKVIFIDQPRFLGDIIFVMAIAQKYTKEGYHIEFPIDDQYLQNASISKNFPSINLIPLSAYQNYDRFHGAKILENDTHKYLLLSDSTFGAAANEHMRYKYESIGLPMKIWRLIRISRDFESENKLMNIIGVKKGEKFNLINEHYSDKKISNMKVEINNDYKNIYMSKVNGFNMFDWMGILERAESIHTVHTSLQYILDVMPNITDDLHIYLRSGIYEPHSYYNYLYEKKYTYHGAGLNLIFEVISHIRGAKKYLYKVVIP